MSKPGSPKDNVQVKIPRGPGEDPKLVNVAIDRKPKEELPYRGGFKDIRTGKYLISNNVHLTNIRNIIHRRI